MAKYKYLNLKGYTCVEIDGRVYLIDNGSQHSFAFNPNNKLISINGETFRLMPNNSWGDRLMDESFGRRIDGIIGTDILNALKSIEVDMNAGTIAFGSIENEYNKSIQLSFCGTHLIEVNGHAQECYFDIGAHMLTIKHRQTVSGLQQNGTVLEGIYNGSLMPFDRYNTNISINGESYNVDAIVIPESIAHCYPYPYFMSISCVASDSFAYDFANNAVMYN